MHKNNSGKSKKSTSKKSSKGRKGGKYSQLGAALVLACLVAFAVSYIYDNIVSKPKYEAAPQEKSAPTSKKESARNRKTEHKDSEAKVGKKSDPAKLQMPGTKLSGAEIGVIASLAKMNPERDLRPTFTYCYSSQVIEHIGYVVSYNSDYKVPNWVLYELNYAETLGNMKRVNNFAVDPEVPESAMAQLSDYKNSGYDRGHMAPNADLNWDVQAQNESFYLSNMCPQGHDFNAGIWLDLENKVRFWAERDSAVTIVCGPVLPKSRESADKMKKIGKGHVLVPEQFYKIVFAPFNKEPRAIAFLMPNHNEKDGRKNRSLEKYVVTVDSIESLTGIDFFPALPDDIEKRIESKYNLKAWF